MRSRILIYFLFLALIVTAVNAQERRPVTVSPGSENRVAMVGQSCPTFSWTGVEWAVAYRVAVFEAVSAEALSYEEMEAVASPALSKGIQGRALSWTPSSDERLSNGGVYVWYVQAVDGHGKGRWSEGKVFKVEVEARLVGMEETVRESLKEHGVSDEMIDDVLRDMQSGVREVLVWGVDTEGSGSKTQDKFGIQGLEGATNTFYGLDAGFSIATGGDYNSFFGRSAGYLTSTGNWNTFIGYYAGYFNTTGYSDTIIGYYAGYNNTASYNTFIGYLAGYKNTTGSPNTFVGYCSGRDNTTGSGNTFIGYCAGYSNTVANQNTFLGRYAGFSNTTASGNTFVGYYAGYNNTTAYRNSFFGRYAGYSNTMGHRNTFVGYEAGNSNTTGYNNTSMGYQSGWTNSSGNNNVFLGYGAGYYETGSNKLYIESSGEAFPLIYGEFDNDIVAINGKLGVGTQSPGYPMHLQKTGANAAFIADRTDGAINYINATASYGNFGTVNNYPLRMVVNALWRMRLDSDNSLTMANGATCTAGGVWTDASSRDLKENIHSLTTEEAIDALKGLNPVKYNYKADKKEDCVGFIAEEVPDLVASKDRKGMSPMDIVAVLTKVVQEQQETIDELRKAMNELKKNK